MNEKNTVILYSTWFGSFLLKDGSVIEHKLFPKDPEELAIRRSQRKEGKILAEERELAHLVEVKLYVTSSRLSELGKLMLGDVPDVLPEEYSFDDRLLHEMLQIIGRNELRYPVSSGAHIAKAINSIQDINETVNILTERLRDWYSLHFPELNEKVGDEDFLRLISKLGERERIIKDTDLDMASVGSDVSEKEISSYREFADLIIKQRKFRMDLAEYLEMKMESEAPSLTVLVGPKLGAELIAQAGSLEKLAMVPSSTIQLLGAEKSLFRHLKKGTPPPKHGYILQHPYVHRSNPGVRGRAARLLANKIAIAARVDYFGGEFIGDKLKEELEEKLKLIRDKK